jgi:hypothetical protein
MLRAGALLVLTTAVVASVDSEAEAKAVRAMKEFGVMLKDPKARRGTVDGSGGSIDSVRDHMVACLPRCGARLARKIRAQLLLGLKPEAEGDRHFHKCVARMLAAGGARGISMLAREFRKARKQTTLRAVIAEALGESVRLAALPVLRKMLQDREPEVVAAAAGACGRFSNAAPGVRITTMRQLIDRYRKLSTDAAGKDPDSRAMHMYRRAKPAMNRALTALSRGESMNSAEAWEAWLHDYAAHAAINK